MLGALALGLAGCGEAAPPGVAALGSNSTTTTAAPQTAPSRQTFYTDELKYAQCMRKHGVTDFPDPSAGGGFNGAVNIPASSPARAACQRLLPAIGGPGSGPPPTPQALAAMLKVSRCMRRHGITDFPDPTTHVPSSLAGVAVINDRDGVILAFPRTLDTRSAQFTRAAKACDFALTNH